MIFSRQQASRHPIDEDVTNFVTTLSSPQQLKDCDNLVAFVIKALKAGHYTVACPANVTPTYTNILERVTSVAFTTDNLAAALCQQQRWWLLARLVTYAADTHNQTIVALLNACGTEAVAAALVAVDPQLQHDFKRRIEHLQPSTTGRLLPQPLSRAQQAKLAINAVILGKNCTSKDILNTIDQQAKAQFWFGWIYWLWPWRTVRNQLIKHALMSMVLVKKTEHLQPLLQQLGNDTRLSEFFWPNSAGQYYQQAIFSELLYQIDETQLRAFTALCQKLPLSPCQQVLVRFVNNNADLERSMRKVLINMFYRLYIHADRNLPILYSELMQHPQLLQQLCEHWPHLFNQTEIEFLLSAWAKHSETIDLNKFKLAIAQFLQSVKPNDVLSAIRKTCYHQPDPEYRLIIGCCQQLIATYGSPLPLEDQVITTIMQCIFNQAIKNYGDDKVTLTDMQQVLAPCCQQLLSWIGPSRLQDYIYTLADTKSSEKKFAFTLVLYQQLSPSVRLLTAIFENYKKNQVGWSKQFRNEVKQFLEEQPHANQDQAFQKLADSYAQRRAQLTSIRSLKQVVSYLYSWRSPLQEKTRLQAYGGLALDGLNDDDDDVNSPTIQARLIN